MNVAVISCSMMISFKGMLREKVLHIDCMGQCSRTKIGFDIFSVNYFLCVGASDTDLQTKFSVNT